MGAFYLFFISAYFVVLYLNFIMPVTLTKVLRESKDVIFDNNLLLYRNLQAFSRSKTTQKGNTRQ